MILEKYSVKYMDDIVRLVDSFHREALKEYMSIDYNALLATIAEIEQTSFLLTTDDKCVGVLAGKPVTTPLSTDRYWHEVLWYVDKKYRKHGVWMLKQAQKLLKVDGYTGIIMVCMHNSMTEKLFKFYQRQGFKPMETHFIKGL
jgi:GNAT superfamily N-acetyltransferase